MLKEVGAHAADASIIFGVVIAAVIIFAKIHWMNYDIHVWLDTHHRDRLDGK